MLWKYLHRLTKENSMDYIVKGVTLIKYTSISYIQDISEKVLQTEMEDRWDTVDEFLIT